MSPAFLILPAALELCAAALAWRAPAAPALAVPWRAIALALAAIALSVLLTALGVPTPWMGEISISRVVELQFVLIFAMGVLIAVTQMRELWVQAEHAMIASEHERKLHTEREELWRRVFEFAPDGYILLTLDGVVERANRAAGEMSGLDRKQTEGRHLFELGVLDEDDLAKAANNLAMLRSGEDPGPAEYTLHRADGTERLVEIAGYTLDNIDRPLMLTIVHDVTERRRTELELRRNRLRLEEAQRVAGLVTWELDVATLRIWVSQDITTSPSIESQSLEMNLDESVAFVHPDDRARVSADIASLLAHPHRREAATEYRQTMQDGRERIVRTISKAELGADGHVERIVGATLDITEIREAEREIRLLNSELEKRVALRTAELERAVDELQAFSYSVSHDLRSPLRAMAGFSELVLRDCGPALDDISKERLERIRASSVRMAAMIDDLLSLSRLARQMRHDARIDLSAMAESIALELRQNDGDRQVDVEIEPGIDAWGDEGMLRLALQNLMANAWKFTRNTRAPRIEVGRTDEGAYYVRDNGVGFDSAQAAKLFRPFERLHRIDEFEGSGIGLAIVARVVRHHQGRAWAESELGAGASFFFTLESAGSEPAKA